MANAKDETLQCVEPLARVRFVRHCQYVRYHVCHCAPPVTDTVSIAAAVLGRSPHLWKSTSVKDSSSRRGTPFARAARHKRTAWRESLSCSHFYVLKRFRARQLDALSVMVRLAQNFATVRMLASGPRYYSAVQVLHVLPGLVPGTLALPLRALP